MPQLFPIFVESLPLRGPHELPELSQLARNSLALTQLWKDSARIDSSSPAKGKWSCGAQMFQNNQSAIIDRVKEILLKNCHDTEKVKQAKMLLGMPCEEEEEFIKIEEEEAVLSKPPKSEETSKDIKFEADSKDSSTCIVRK